MTKYDRRLRNWFRQYNDTYFDGRLEEPEIIRYGKMKIAAGETKWCEQGPTTLMIHEDLIPFPRLTQIVLIHEMAHIGIGSEYIPSHGTRFQAEMFRLYMVGAYEGLL